MVSLKGKVQESATAKDNSANTEKRLARKAHKKTAIKPSFSFYCLHPMSGFTSG
ncbi:hypothetical protein QYZ42_07715 [Vibrio parahaemolyticus]|nr:hypothetical protein [Vibrio parahaemolyticus]